MLSRTTLVAVLLCLGCPGGDGGDGSSGTTDGTSSAPVTATDPSGEPTSTGDGPTTVDPTSTPSTPTTTTIDSAETGPDDTSTTGDPDPTDTDSTSTGPGPDPGVPEVHYVGRHDKTDPTHVRMGWSGTGLVFRFDGTDASVRLDDSAKYFTVVVDGTLQPTLATVPGEQSYPVAIGLPAGEHTVEVYRRTEGFFGLTTVLGVDLPGGELLPPPPVTRRVEVIGDSISCGYGNEGQSPCSFSAETENHYLTYGAFAARSVGAEISTVSWSGKGVIYNYDQDKNEPLPQIYDRTLPQDGGSMWGFEWQPDVVVINLGTNDFSTGDDPPEDVFVPAYVAFLTHLREVYPGAFIIPVAPLLFGDEATMVAGYLQDAVDQRHAAGDPDVAFHDINVQAVGIGCDGHPSVATHELMGEKLAAAFQEHLGW